MITISSGKSVYNRNLSICLTVLTLLVISSFHLYGQESKFFDYTIKGETCEYNVKKSVGTSIIISNVSNSYGTDKQLVIQDYGKTYSKEEYISIYKIIKSSIDPKVFNKLLIQEKFPMRNLKLSDTKAREKFENSSRFGIAVVFAPVTGKIYEITFKVSGKILMNLSPDCFYEIEKKIKESGITHKLIIEKKWQFYVVQHYEYYFNDLDSFTRNGEKIKLSDIN